MIESQESVTAKLCSFARAYHSNFVKNKIFDDYLAYDLMGKENYERTGYLIEKDFDEEASADFYNFKNQNIREKLDELISPIPLSRIAYAERELARFAWERGECQYVILGAGMDTFSFRNENDNITVFEVDHPDTQRYKLECIKELEWNIPKNVRYVAVDFSRDDMEEKLLNAGFDPTRPSFFAILGVTYYLTLPIFEGTVEKIRNLSSAGSKLVFDYPDDEFFAEDAVPRVKKLAEITEALGEQMQHGYAYKEVEDALLRHGFLIDDHADPKKIQKRFFEGRDDNLRAYENIHLILAKKGDPENESYYFYI